MKTMKNSKGALAVAAVALVVAASYGCDQPEPQCATGRGLFIARYKVVSGGADCAAIKGEIVGVNTYSAVGEGQPDYDKASAALESTTTSNAVNNAAAADQADPDKTHQAYSLGNFTESKSTNNVCHIPTLAPSIQTLPAIPEDEDLGTSEQAATTITYAWSNLTAYVTAQSNGTQLTADLVYSDTAAGLNCTYKVQLLSPSVDCTLVDTTKPSPKPILDANGKPQPDPTACLPAANDGAGNGATKHPTGSGINPDFKTHCDPELLQCVLDDGAGLLPF